MNQPPPTFFATLKKVVGGDANNGNSLLIRCLPLLASSPTKFFRTLIFLCFLTQNIVAQSRWERIYNEFPVAGEAAFGLETTADGGFLVLASRGFDTQSAQTTYMMKVDADGAVQWKHDLGLGGGVKISRLTTGNFGILTRRRNFPDSVFKYSYLLCTPTGTVLNSGLLTTDSSVQMKATFLTPIVAGLSSGGFALAAKGIFPGQFVSNFIRTFAENGDPQNVFATYQIPQDSFSIRCITQTSDGFFHGVGYFDYPSQDDADGVWFKMSHDGHMEPNWFSVFDDDPDPTKKNADKFHDIARATDGNFWVLNLRNANLGPFLDSLFLMKYTPSGSLISKKYIAPHVSNLDFAGLDRSKILPLAEGGAVILYETFVDTTVGEDFSLIKVDEAGNKIWTRHFGREKRFTESPFDVVRTADGGFGMVGWFNDELFDSNDAYLIRTDPAGLVSSNYIEGTVFADINLNCQKDAGEPPLGGWMMRLERNGKPAFNTLTGADGKYALPTDTGFSVVRITPAANYWQTCQDTAQVFFAQTFDSVAVNFGSKPVFVCPQLEVDIAAPFLRRCFNSDYTVTFANRGTQAASNVTIQIDLDPNLIFISSTGNWSWSGGQIFNFNIGNLAIGQIGSFRIRVKVDCDFPLGATLCTSANIFPNTACTAPSNWSGASIAVDGTCQDSVQFSVKNVGSGNITTAVEYVIVEDEVIFRTGSIFNLPPNGALDTLLKVPANGSTWRLETSQEPGHPGNSQPSVAVEGCGASGNFGYVTIFPEDDGDPFVSTDCQENIGSFDPNDKQGFPRGVGSEHYIFPETDLEYLIRFQNTGTDTAFSVVVKDTLSKDFDLNSVRPGPSSHPYKFEILNENVLKFSFNNILLPDSTTNEVASHGFVKFTVRHRTDLPLGSVLRNSAAIYFDFNEAVITNETWHTVDTGFLKKTDVEVENLPGKAISNLKIYPNPVANHAILTLKNGNSSAISGRQKIQICNFSGQVIFEKNLVGGQCIFEKGAAPSGVYFVKLIENQKVVAVGKIIF